ncbi:kynurenine formamidase [Constrictibacter sp. MBR-5]|jgi:kynurenine formamidase|uniref:cyclase family protein n=1 Tax=Constrictibacter sp. MBR-5 TaxID=3156467 RepID=UPI003399B187
MRRITLGLALSAALLASPSLHAQQAASGWSPPPESERCPSKWGAGDERGSANHMKPESVRKAAALIKTGEVVELGHTLSGSIPFFGTRRFDVHTKRTFANTAPNNRGSNEEIVITEIGQVGTQLDGFAHQTHGNSFYNCFKVDETATRTGFTKLGIDKVGMLMGRGVLIDVAASKGVEMLPDNYEITVEDLEAALEKQGTTLQPGDAIVINTGWGKLWGKDNARYVKTCPGIGVAAALWLAEKDPMLLGADNWPVEVAPNPDPKLSLPVHQIALVVNGIHLLENMKLEELAAKKVHEFAFMMQPIKVQGGTGSAVAPVAVH